MVDSQASGDYADVVSRRKFVSLVSATGAAAVAGCLGDDDDGDDSGGGGDDELWFTATQVDFTPDTYHWNPLAGWNVPHDQFGIFAQWTQYLIEDDEFHPHLVQDWEHNDGEMVLTLSEEFTWGSGDSITAEDLVFQMDVAEAADQPVWQFIEDVEATDEYELTVTYPSDMNTDLVEYAMLSNAAEFSPSLWEDEDWENDPAGVEIDNPDPSGPLAVTDVTDTYSQTEPRDGLDDFEDHHLADRYNWDGYRVEHRDGNSAAHTSFIEDEVDGTHSLFADPETLDEFPDHVHEFRVPGGFGMAIWFDHDEEPWDQREARQALMYSIDRASVIESVGESTKISHHPAQTGLTWASVENWFDSTEPEGFTVYERDTDMAEELLDEIGLTPGDVEVPLVFPQTWSDWATASQTIISHLEDAGWDVTDESTSEGPGEYAASDDWTVCIDQHTEGGRPEMNHPYFSLDYILRNRLRDTDGHFANYPDEVDVDGETIDIESELDTIATTNDEDEQRESVEKLARVVNEDLPCLVIMEKYEQSFINGARFDVPDESEHFYTYWPLWWLPKVDETLDGYDTPGLLKASEN